METNGYQKELFELEKPKRSFPRLDTILSRNDFAITLTMERTIFVVIGLIMLAILIYAVGVERGKALGLGSDWKKEVRSKQATVTLAVPSAIPASVQAAQKSPAAQSQTIIKKYSPLIEKPVAQNRAPERIYSIVAASFSRREWALKEVDLLKKAGYDAFVYESNPYFLVRVGSYANKESSQVTLKKIKKVYKDAYLKLR